MNREHVLQLADHIENLPPTKFLMRYWLDSDFKGEATSKDQLHCNTVGCIAGHTILLFSPLDIINAWLNPKLGKVPDIKEIAAKELGLAPQIADKLFTPSGHLDYGRITNKIAAQVLRNLAHTGRVEYPNEALDEDYLDEGQ